MSLADAYLTATRAQFAQYKSLADRAVQQVEDAAFFTALGSEDNSLAILMKHLAGNLRSRFTDFLTTDGEKSDRHRDTEFVLTDADTRAALQVRWEAAWQILFDTLDSLGPDDLLHTVTLRAQPMPALAAIQRALAHVSSHVGQIVLLAKHFAGENWQTLSIPRGGSEAFTKQLQQTEKMQPR